MNSFLSVLVSAVSDNVSRMDTIDSYIFSCIVIKLALLNASQSAYAHLRNLDINREISNDKS